MKLLILLQVLIITIEIRSQAEDEPNTTVIVHDTRTEMTVERVDNPSRGKASQFFQSLEESESNGIDLDFDYDDGPDTVKSESDDTETKEQEMQEALLKAMRKPGIRKQIGEVIPILRVMSPAQRLTLAALVSSQIMSQNTPSESNLTEMAAMFAGENVDNPDDRHNITEHLLLPISIDIAKMFKGLGREMGRNLRQNFNRPHQTVVHDSKFRRVLRKPPGKTSPTPNRRMDEMEYETSEEENERSKRPMAEALKQPGKDECDFFTKSLCLEVSNYPTEAIISSLKKNQDIAKTFLTDFHVQPDEEGPGRRKVQGNGRLLERRQDGQNEVQDVLPEASYMCPSSVKYARPKRARATSGQWKYIVNAGDYTQTLRLEICQKPKSPCSYVTNHLDSQCSQVFNYHRLLTWDENKGLHMDIFKVPSCCSCHIQGYSTFYPPSKGFMFAEKRREPPEQPDFAPNLQERPPYNAVGTKREVPKPVGVAPVTSPPQFSLNIKEFPRNPVDHLVPPGPPLPLDNESVFNPQLDVKYGQQNVEHNRRFPVPAEHPRGVNKVTERIEINEPPVSRSKPQLPLPPNLKILHPGPVPNVPQKPSSMFESSNQVHFIKPLPSTPPPFRGPDIVRGKPEGGLFITAKPNELVLPHGPTPNPKPPAQYFKTQFSDVKSLPSRVNPFYVTAPPQIKEIQARTTTVPPAPQKSDITSSGHKKINYNYHPIIDFFIPEARKRQAPAYSGPQYAPLSSQDWTPVLGH